MHNALEVLLQGEPLVPRGIRALDAREPPRFEANELDARLRGAKRKILGQYAQAGGLAVQGVRPPAAAIHRNTRDPAAAHNNTAILYTQQVAIVVTKRMPPFELAGARVDRVEEFRNGRQQVELAVADDRGIVGPGTTCVITTRCEILRGLLVDVLPENPACVGVDGRNGGSSAGAVIGPQAGRARADAGFPQQVAVFGIEGAQVDVFARRPHRPHEKLAVRHNRGGRERQQPDFVVFFRPSAALPRHAELAFRRLGVERNQLETIDHPLIVVAHLQEVCINFVADGCEEK